MLGAGDAFGRVHLYALPTLGALASHSVERPVQVRVIHVMYGDVVLTAVCQDARAECVCVTNPIGRYQLGRAVCGGQLRRERRVCVDAARGSRQSLMKDMGTQTPVLVGVIYEWMTNLHKLHFTFSSTLRVPHFI
jgi:hypothetical protein